MLLDLRLLADDLTGALDSAAAFGAHDEPVRVVWNVRDVAAGGQLAFDSGTREVGPGRAAANVRDVTPLLFRAPQTIRFKKIDSLLRGSEAEEIDAILGTIPFRCCVIAPAFPAQGRITRKGRHGLIDAEGRFTALETDLRARLEALGHAVSRLPRGHGAGAGIVVVDAETDADLDATVAASIADDVLWVGSAGLAAALARRFAPGGHEQAAPLRTPFLGLFGTNHPVMLDQLSAVPRHHVRLTSLAGGTQVARRLRDGGAVVVTVDMPSIASRGAAAERIDALFADLVRALDPPATLMVAGGETLRALCGALAVDHLDVVGEVSPGIPRSILVGGPWDGTAVISKSGAFGAPDLLSSLLADLSAPASGVPVA